VLFMSGCNEEVIRNKGVLHTGVAYPPKPFGPAERAAKVQDVMAEARKKTIPVVDEEAAIRGLFEARLGTKYRILAASDGKEALRKLADAREVDLVMPNQEGIETIRAPREKHSGMRIFAMSEAFDGQC